VTWRPWPAGLAGQIAACVVLALVIAQSLTGLLAIVLDPRHPPPMDPAARIAVIIEALDGAPATDRPRIAAALDHGATRVALGRPDGDRAAPPEPGPDDGLRRMIEDRLGARFPLRVTEPSGVGGGPHPVFVEAQLGDGAWVTVKTENHGPPNIVEFGLWRLFFYLPVLVALIAVLTIWATRRVTAPLRAFADAAERLGNERSAPPLAEEGPAEIRRAARSFNKMQDQVTRFVEDRTRMLAAISHDMRTPITRLRLRVETVVDDEADQQKMLQDLDRMDAMVASALSFLRHGTRDEPVELVDLASLLQSVCDDFSDTGRDARYAGVDSLSLRCRPDMMTRAMTNLVDNAVKFAGKAIVDLRRDDRGNAVVHVDDDGPGIGEEEKARAFDPFYRADRARSVETGGVGLGLSIAKAIVETHRGTITLLDLEPRGLRAIVTLPISLT
jgi:signal transduction histidine kinase